jgi:N-acetylneuraminic acid mutarotase
VQVYDAEKNTWGQATPFPGVPVFGHAGGLVDDSIVFVDGAKKNPGTGSPYMASDECWLGRIDHKDPYKISWSKLPAHPGPGRVGIIAGSEGNKIIFSGGTTAPHNFRGLGDDGKPAEISSVSFVYEAHGNKWDTLTEDASDARFDSGGILNTPVGSVIIGGMLQNQAATARVMMVVKK